MSKHKIKNKNVTQVGIPAGAKYIMVYENGGQLTVTSGGFVNFDEMLGFNRRVINANLTEGILLEAFQKQMGGALGAPIPPPSPKEEHPKKE